MDLPKLNYEQLRRNQRLRDEKRVGEIMMEKCGQIVLVAFVVRTWVFLDHQECIHYRWPWRCPVEGEIAMASIGI